MVVLACGVAEEVPLRDDERLMPSCLLDTSDVPLCGVDEDGGAELVLSGRYVELQEMAMSVTSPCSLELRNNAALSWASGVVALCFALLCFGAGPARV